jgi:hypothetical protein
MLREIIEKLLPSLDGEEKTEYVNSAIVGGTGAHFAALTARALEAIDNGSDAVPVTAEFTLQRLHDIWKIYPYQEMDRRVQIVRVTRELLDKLQDTLDSAPVSEASSERREARIKSPPNLKLCPKPL